MITLCYESATPTVKPAASASYRHECFSIFKFWLQRITHGCSRNYFSSRIHNLTWSTVTVRYTYKGLFIRNKLCRNTKYKTRSEHFETIFQPLFLHIFQNFGLNLKISNFKKTNASGVKKNLEKSTKNRFLKIIKKL